MLHLSCLSPSPVLTSSSERIAEPLPYPKSLVPPQVSSFLTLTPYLVLQQILLALTPKHIHHVPPSHCHNAVSLLGKLLSHSAPHNSQGEILKCKQDHVFPSRHWTRCALQHSLSNHGITLSPTITHDCEHHLARDPGRFCSLWYPQCPHTQRAESMLVGWAIGEGVRPGTCLIMGRGHTPWFSWEGPVFTCHPSVIMVPSFTLKCPNLVIL